MRDAQSGGGTYIILVHSPKCNGCVFNATLIYCSSWDALDNQEYTENLAGTLSDSECDPVLHLDIDDKNVRFWV